MTTDDEFGEEEEHPAYIMAGFYRCQGNPGPLFGSALGAVHGSYITFRAVPASRSHRLKGDNYHQTSMAPVFEMDLSAAQFAEMITTMNMGSGVPCTMRRLDAREIPAPPKDDLQETGRVKASFQKDLRSANKEVRRISSEILKLVADKLPAARKRQVEILFEQIERVLGSNAEFALERFMESTERLEAASKAEIEAFMTHALTNAGLAALQEKFKSLEAAPPAEPQLGSVSHDEKWSGEK